MATATRTRIKKTEFVNRTQGYLGVVQFNRKDDPIGVGVKPGGRVFLTDDEIKETERSHAKAEDSPFKIREIVHRDPMTGEETARFTAPLLEKVAD